MASLADIGRSQADTLERFRAAATDSSVLRELVETHCLLELSKLATSRVDLSTYAELVVGIVAQFFPVESCAVEIAVDGLPTTRAGAWDAAIDPYALTADGHPAGSFVVRVREPAMSGPSFFASAADQISASLGSIVEGERLRRQAAAATALRLSASLADDPSDRVLCDLAVALASLPTAAGARLSVEHPVFGPPIEVCHGHPDGQAESWRVDLASGHLTVQVTWAGQPSPADIRTVNDVLGTIAAAMTKATERQRIEVELDTDPLTGIGNRRCSERRLVELVARAARLCEPLAVLYMDLDEFKKVNDTLGHGVGDEVLRHFAGGVGSDLRGYDVLARIGGEEFMVVAPGLDASGAKVLATRLRARTPRWAAPALPADWTQTVSIGIAVYPEAGDSPEALVRAADAAMYEAKRSGRNRFAFADDGAVGAERQLT